MAILAVNGKAKCRVTHTDDSVIVRSLATGKELTVTKAALKFGSMLAYHTLTRHAVNVGREMDLDIDIMRKVAEVAGLIQVQQTEAQTTEAARISARKEAETKVIEQGRKELAQTVVERTRNRVSGKGTSQVEREIDTLQKVVKITDQRFYFFSYDIPTSLTKECPSPCAELWRFAFRDQKSVWIMPESSTKHPVITDMIAHWKQFGVKTRCIPFDQSAMGDIRALALENLRARIVEVHTSLIERIQNAASRYEEAVKEFDKRATPATAADHERVEMSRIANIRGSLYNSEQGLETAIECAKLFDEEENVQDLLRGLRAAILSEKASLAYLLENRTRA